MTDRLAGFNLAFMAAITAASILAVGCQKSLPKVEPRISKLAIMPLKCTQDDPSTSHLGFSLAEQVITKLSYISTVIVRPSQSVRVYKDREINLENVARDLDVDFILTGSYLQQGGELRLTTQLLNALSTEVIWQDSCVIDYSATASLGDTLAVRIIDALRLRLSSDEKHRLQKDRSRNPLAHEYYLKAIAQDPADVDDWRDQIHLLEMSAELDSLYAPAMAALGNAYMQYSGKVGGRRGYYDQAEKTLRRALEINPSLPRTMYLLASLYAKTGRAEESAALHHEALTVHSNKPNFYAGLGYIYRYAGLMDESIRAYQRSQSLDSSYQNLISTQGQITKSLIYQGHYRDAASSHDKVNTYLAALGQSVDEKKLFYKGVIYYYMKDMDRAISLFDSASTLDKESVWSLFGQTYKEALHGNTKRMQDLTERLEARNIVDGERRYRLVHFFALIGKECDALRNLSVTIDGGFFNYPYMKSDPLIANLHVLQEFQDLMEVAKRRHETLKRTYGGIRK